MRRLSFLGRLLLLLLLFLAFFNGLKTIFLYLSALLKFQASLIDTSFFCRSHGFLLMVSHLKPGQ